MKTQLQTAIDRSISHNEIVAVEIDAETIDSILPLIDVDTYGQFESVRENDGSYDVWGFSDDATEGLIEWRIKIRLTDWVNN